MSPFIFSQKTNLFFHSYFVTPITHLYSQPLQSSFLLAFHTCFISYDFHSDLNLFSLMFFITMFSNRLTVLSFPLSSYYTYYLLLFSHTSFDLFGQYISWSTLFLTLNFIHNTSHSAVYIHTLSAYHTIIFDTFYFLKRIAFL